MHSVSLAAALLLAVASGEVTLDPASGVWFPPYASRDTYLYGNDPAHPYSGDVKKAFEEDPQLAQRVCAAIAAWQPPANAASNPALQQKKAMLDMICVIRAQQERTKKEHTTIDEAAGARLEQELAIATGDALDKVGRQLTEAEKRLREALKAAAKHPSNSGPAYELIIALSETRWVPQRQDAARVVSQFYKRRAAPGDASYHWLSGYRYALFYAGDVAEARKVMERVLAAKTGAYDPLFDALLERIEGHPQRYQELIRNCPAPSAAEIAALYGYTEPEIHCRAWVDGLVARAIKLHPPRIAEPLQDVIREDAASPYLIIAVNAARTEAQFDRASAKRHFQRIVDMPEDEVPSGIRSDAVEALAVLGAQ